MLVRTYHSRALVKSSRKNTVGILKFGQASSSDKKNIEESLAEFLQRKRSRSAFVLFLPRRRSNGHGEMKEEEGEKRLKRSFELFYRTQSTVTYTLNFYSKKWNYWFFLLRDKSKKNKDTPQKIGRLKRNSYRKFHNWKGPLISSTALPYSLFLTRITSTL